MATIVASRPRIAAERIFFTAVAASMLAAVIIGFGPVYYFLPVQAAPANHVAASPLVHLHGGIFSAWMLLFIFATNEISATILLYTPQSQTIAVRVWTAVQSLGAMQAFAYATVQSVIVGIVLFLAYRFFGVVGHVEPQSVHGPANEKTGDVS